MSPDLVIFARPTSLSRPKNRKIAWPTLWLRRSRNRRALLSLEPEQIREAGLDPFAVRDEGLKPFWRE